MLVSSQPQTPRTKLSIDIPSSYSSNIPPDSPSSFTLSSPPSYTPRGTSVPASPTMSGSWNVSKTQAELTVLLKDAYGTIRERERDLTLAAEIGKSLLENNISLKEKYESAIVQLQHLQRERKKAASFTLHQIDKSATQIAPPDDSLNYDDQDDYDDSDNESHRGRSTSIDLYSQQSDNSFKRKNHQNSSSGLNYKDLENLKELETRNQNLQQQLEEVIKEYDNSNKSNKAKIRKLEADLLHYQDACTSATQKVEDLEKEYDGLKQKQKADFWNLKYTKKSNENDDYIEALVQKVQELEEQNSLIERTKTEIERRLTRTADELNTLKVEYNDMIDTTRNYEMLQVMNRDQEKLIEELSENLEEQRALVTSYRSGMWSQKTSRANSISDGGNIMSNALRRLSDATDFGGISKQSGQNPSGIGGKIRKTLLSELENEWFRELTIFQQDVKKGPSDSQVSSPRFTPMSSQKDLHDYFITNGAEDDLDYMSDDAFSFLDEFDANDDFERIREWFWKRWIKAIFRFLRTIWRWVRFIVILIAAVFMALYRGPDDVLPSEM